MKLLKRGRGNITNVTNKVKGKSISTEGIFMW